MKNETKKGWQAVEFMRERKEQINKIIKDMTFEEQRKYLDDFINSVPKDDPLYDTIQQSKQTAVAEPKNKYEKNKSSSR